jgi:hypothetical protein
MACKTELNLCRNLLLDGVVFVADAVSIHHVIAVHAVHAVGAVVFGAVDVVVHLFLLRDGLLGDDLRKAL